MSRTAESPGPAQPSSIDAPPGFSDRRLWLILGLAAGIRLAWVLNIDAGALHTPGLLDSSFYLGSARRLWAGMGYVGLKGDPTAYFAPGYTFIIAPLVGLFGAKLAPALLNVLAATLTCLATYQIGARAHGHGVGLLAAFLLAILPGYLIGSSAIMADIVYTALLTGCILLFARLRATNDTSSRLGIWRWGLLGFCVGATTLVRGPSILIPPVFGLLLLLEVGVKREPIVRTALMIGGLALALVPWTLRNAVVLGAFVPIAVDGGWSLFNAHNPKADGGQSLAMNEMRRELFPEVYALPKPQREVALEKAQVRYAIEYALTHPKQELQQIPLRLKGLHDGDFWAHKWIGTRDRSADRGRRMMVTFSHEVDDALRIVVDSAYFTLLALALIGIPLALRQDRPETWLAPMILLYFHCLHGLLFFGIPRFHVPFLPMLAITAGVAIAEGVGWVRERRGAQRGGKAPAGV